MTLKHFIRKSFVLIILPTILFLGLYEYLYREIPNDFKIKKENLLNRKDSIETLIFGTSHAYHGINPSFIPYGYNLANEGQSLIFDKLLYCHYINRLPNLKNIFDITVGVSDHSLHPFLIPLLSVLQGGTIIEKHITLSKTTEGLDDPVALTIPQFKKMTEKIKEFQQNSQETMYQSLYEEFGMANIEKILGTGEKKLAESEKNNYSRTNRSLHYLHNLPKGHKISEQDIAILRASPSE